MSKVNLWEGVCTYKGEEMETVIYGSSDGIVFSQEFRGEHDVIGMGRDEAIDIAFAILKDCAPTLAEALEGIRGPAAAGANAITDTDFRQQGDSNFI